LQIVDANKGFGVDEKEMRCFTHDKNTSEKWDENESRVVTYSDVVSSGEKTYVLMAPEGSTITVKDFADCGFTAPVGKTFSHWKEKWTKTVASQGVQR